MKQMNPMQHPLFLIFDGMSQAYRAHFAIRDLSNSQGLPTNAVYGFALMLKRVLQKYPPEYIAIALDGPAPTARRAGGAVRRRDWRSDIQGQGLLLFRRRWCCLFYLGRGLRRVADEPVECFPIFVGEAFSTGTGGLVGFSFPQPVCDHFDLRARRAYKTAE
jgi:hypothetical protein